MPEINNGVEDKGLAIFVLLCADLEDWPSSPLLHPMVASLLLLSDSSADAAKRLHCNINSSLSTVLFFEDERCLYKKRSMRVIRINLYLNSNVLFFLVYVAGISNIFDFKELSCFLSLLCLSGVSIWPQIPQRTFVEVGKVTGQRVAKASSSWRDQVEIVLGAAMCLIKFLSRSVGVGQKHSFSSVVVCYFCLK